MSLIIQYNKLTTLFDLAQGKGYPKVYMQKPPIDWNTPWWDNEPTAYSLTKVGKRKSQLIYSFSPKTGVISRSNLKIYTQAEWDAAREQWSKDRMWKAISHV